MSELTDSREMRPTASGLPAGVVSARVEPRKRRRWQMLLWGVLSGAVLTLFGAWLIAFLGGYRYSTLSDVALSDKLSIAPKQNAAQLDKRLKGMAPKDIYIVVDTVENRLYLRRGDETIRTAVCSTGTGGLLTDPSSGRQWVFETPLGRREVKGKKEDPIWVKPEWALVEEGLDKKTAKAEDLADDYSLGKYAMDIGDGYRIHGTLYTRLLGKSVTHGCVRLGDEDLEAVYKAARIGTPVYLY